MGVVVDGGGGGEEEVEEEEEEEEEEEAFELNVVIRGLGPGIARALTIIGVLFYASFSSSFSGDCIASSCILLHLSIYAILDDSILNFLFCTG